MAPKASLLLRLGATNQKGKQTMRYYPKGGWNVRIKADISTFVDAWMNAYYSGNNYTSIAESLGCKKVDVEFAEARLRKIGVNLPKLNLNEDNDDSEYCFVGI